MTVTIHPSPLKCFLSCQFVIRENGFVASVSYGAAAATAATSVGKGRNMSRRRSAVYGFSPNTGLSIGAAM